MTDTCTPALPSLEERTKDYMTARAAWGEVTTVTIASAAEVERTGGTDAAFSAYNAVRRREQSAYDAMCLADMRRRYPGYGDGSGFGAWWPSCRDVTPQVTTLMECSSRLWRSRYDTRLTKVRKSSPGITAMLTGFIAIMPYPQHVHRPTLRIDHHRRELAKGKCPLDWWMDRCSWVSRVGGTS